MSTPSCIFSAGNDAPETLVRRDHNGNDSDSDTSDDNNNNHDDKFY